MSWLMDDPWGERHSREIAQFRKELLVIDEKLASLTQAVNDLRADTTDSFEKIQLQHDQERLSRQLYRPPGKFS